MNIINELHEALELASGYSTDEVNQRLKGIVHEAGGDSFGHAIRQACSSIRAIPGNPRKEDAIAEARLDISRVSRLHERSLAESS